MSAPRLLHGRYEVGEVIGRGGMADVHEGYDTRLSRTVAIKLLRSDLARDASFLTRFRREAQSAAGLNHPAIVAIYDSGDEPSVDARGTPMAQPFIVMEFVQGVTLRQRLAQDGPLEPHEAAGLTGQVLAALAYSHRMGIVHRDIKPANVMLTPSGDVKVMDFGIARAVADTAATMTQTQAVVGTAQYLSPEQAQGKQVDARSDLYSTGCLLFELLTGRTPFVGDTPVAVAYQHVGEPPTPPSHLRRGIPAAFDAVVLHALTKDREARYQSAIDFHADLVAAREGRAVSAAALGTAEAAAVAGAPTAVISSSRRRRDGDTAALPAIGRDPADEPPRRRSAAYLLLALAAVAGVVLLVLLGRSLLAAREAAARIAVPYVIGKAEAEARALVAAAGLAVDVRSVTNPNVTQGVVADQDPTGQTQVTQGTIVHLVVSSGPGQAVVPYVAGQTQEAAVATLKLSGFLDPAIAPVDDPAQTKGNAVGTDPGTGQVVALSQRITLKVATGKVKVTNLVGMNFSVAEQKLADLRLVYDGSQQVESDTQLEGTVLEQDVAPDTVVDVGTTVKVKIAKRPAPPTQTVTTTVTTTPSTGPTVKPSTTKP